MTDKQMVSLLRAEIATLRFVVKWENLGVKIFDNEIDMGNYLVLYYILDELGVPEDSSKTPRDKYNDMYMEFYYDYEGELKDKHIQQFITRLKKETKK